LGLTRIESVDKKLASNEVLRLASALDKASEHPIAVEIIQKVKEDKI